MSNQSITRDFSYDSAVWTKTEHRSASVWDWHAEHRSGEFRLKCSLYGSLITIKEERGVKL